MQNTSVSKCEICKRDAANLILCLEENLWLCPDCSNRIYGCAGCAHNVKCQLKINPLKLQEVVVQTIRQGNQVVNIQTINPELFKTYCPKCICGKSNEDNTYCMRECCARCDNWELLSELKKEN